ncbi:MAG: DMT family transporter [Alphaproteobacteria bacterium]
MLWISMTIMAAVFQTVRNSVSKQLSVVLSPNAVSYVRFLFALPVAGIYLLILQGNGLGLPVVNAQFWVFVFLTALVQIIATSLMISLFKSRNFAVGITYAKTEPFQIAILGTAFFGESLNLWGWVAVLISVVGVIFISMGRTGHLADSLSVGAAGQRVRKVRDIIFGLGSGLCYALTSLFVRQASHTLEGGHPLTNAALTLFFVLLIQMVFFGIYLFLRERQEVLKIFQNCRLASIVGIAGGIASIGWFTAFTLQNPAYVKTLGQIEFLLSFAISYFIFKERLSSREWKGIFLTVLAVFILLLMK